MKQKKTVFIILGVVTAVLVTVGIVGTAAYLVYKNYSADNNANDSQSVSSTVTDFEARDTDGSTITAISNDNLAAAVQILTTAKIVAQQCMPVDSSELEYLKNESEFYIYLNFENPVEITLDGNGSGNKMEIPEIYIWGPNDDAASLYILDEASGKWLCYGLWNVEDEEALYELVFDKKYESVLKVTEFDIPELNIHVTLDGNFCSLTDTFVSGSDGSDVVTGELIAGEIADGGSDEESYYRIDCSSDNVYANAKIMVNPLITGGGFGFDAIQKIGYAEKHESFEEVTILGKKYVRHAIGGEGPGYSDNRDGVWDIVMIYSEVYFGLELTEESTPVFELNGNTVIFGYEIEVRNEQFVTSEFDNVKKALDDIFLNMEEIQ